MFAQRRSKSPHPFLFLVTFGLLFIVPVVTSVAQIDPVRTAPTQAPTAAVGAFQANPTQPPEPDPIDDIQANPTNTPTPRPPRGPDDVVANPTEAPDTVIDDVQANPTEAPGVDDVEANPTTGTVRVIKRDCPLGIVEDAFLSDYLTICTQQHDGVEFVLNDVNGAQAGTTAGGQVEWTGVDPGVFEIVETVPAGYGDPIVFCGFTESPGGGIQHPSLQTSTGGLVAGSFPDTLFEYGCYWMNIPTETGFGGPDSVTNPEDLSNTLVTRKWICPGGIAGGQSLGSYLDECEFVDFPVEFTLTNDDGGSAVATSAGKAEWNDVPLGPFTIQEAIPAGYGEPIVFCGWTAYYQGAVYDAFHQLVPSPGGLVEGEISVPNTFYFCHFFNAEQEIDDVQANPTEAPRTAIDDVTANPTNPPETVIDDFQVNPIELGTLTVRKWVCPAFYDPLVGSPLADCTESLDGVAFELDNHDPGQPDLQAVTGDVIGGAAVFEPEPGTYSLLEQIPDGYEQPFLWDCTGLDNPAVMAPPISTINFFRIVIGAGQDIECDWMNVIDNDNHIVIVHSFACPEGGDPTDDYWTMKMECTEPVEGVEFSLTTDGGTVDGLTDTGGGFKWTDVDLGDSGELQITESLSMGSANPKVWCVSFPEVAGDIQDYEFFQVPAADGLITASPEQHDPYIFSCLFFNAAADGVEVIDDVVVANPTEAPETVIDDLQANPASDSPNVTVVKRDCPLGVVEDASLSDYLVICSQEHNGVDFTLNHAGGSEPATTASGEAAWTDVPLGDFDIQEELPAGYGDPIVFCGFTESPGGGVQHPALQASDGGLVTGALDVEGAEFVCYWMNIPSDPDAGIDDFQANPTEPS